FASWIIRKGAGDFARGTRSLAQFHPSGGKVRDKIYARRQGGVNAGSEFEIRAMSSFRLAGNRAGNQSPVPFWKNHIHGEIGGAKAARIFLPLRLRGAGENRL